MATLLLTFAAAPLPAHAADPITLDDPGAMPLEFAVGANTLDLAGTLDDLADNVVVLLMDGAKNSFSPVCGPVAPEPEGTWSCTTDPLPDHIGFLVAVAEIGEHTAEYPYQGITAPTLDPSSAGLTSENPTPTFTGTVPEGGVTSTVTVTVDGAVGCTTTVAPGDPWSCDIPDGVMATLNHVYVIEPRSSTARSSSTPPRPRRPTRSSPRRWSSRSPSSTSRTRPRRHRRRPSPRRA